MKVLLYHNMIAPYRHALFDALARQCELLVAYSTERTRDRQWSLSDDRQYEGLVLPNTTLYAFGRPFTLVRGLRPLVDRFAPDVIVATLTRSNAVDVLRLLAIARRAGCRFVPWVGDVDKSLVPASVPTPILRILDGMRLAALRRADACISYSKLTDAWLEQRVPQVPRVTGTQVLGPSGQAPRLDPSAEADPVRMLFVGKHEPRKGLRELAEAVWLLGPERRRLSLVTAGAGPLRDKLREWLPADVDLDLRGQQPATRLAELYRAADFLVLPSLEDPWGFVTSEAMSLGTPVACSDRCGSVELAERAGWRFDVANPRSIADALDSAMRQCRSRERRERAVAAEAELRPGPAAARIVGFLEALGG